MAENSESQRKNSQKPAKKGGPGKPFRPGQSGNPGGRPRGLAEMVRERTGGGVSLVDPALAMAEGREVFGMAPTLRDVQWAVEFLADRGWGKTPQPLEHSGEAGGPMVVEVVRYNQESGK